ncbi:t-SNARE [Trametes meyenii]|nr:t-SNARE [Trametes meyenii]
MIVRVDIADQVKEILAGVEAKITALDKLHAKHVLPGFSDRSAEEREIEAATTDITKDFRQCQTLIQRIGSVPQHSFPPSQPGQSRHHELAAKNVQRGLAARVQELSATFRKKQRVYMEKLQGHAIKNQDLLAASGAVSLKGSAGMSALDEDVEAAAASHEDAIMRQMGVPDIDLQTRDRELTEIAKSIASLAELFKDLSALVIDQGTLLDSVEYNIEQTAVHMEDAVRELDVATKCVPCLALPPPLPCSLPCSLSFPSLFPFLPFPPLPFSPPALPRSFALRVSHVHPMGRRGRPLTRGASLLPRPNLTPPAAYQKNTGRRQCIFLLLLIIFGLVIALIFKPRRHHSSPAPSPSLDAGSAPASSTVDASIASASASATAATAGVVVRGAVERVLLLRRGVYR